MYLVSLVGPPGVGKLTVGQELVALTGFKLFHNHLTLNLIESVFPRESGPWVRVLREIRRVVFAEAAREGVDLVFTNVFRGPPEQREAVERQIEPVLAHGGTAIWVQLTCERDELLRRAQEESRVQHGKLTDPAIAAEVIGGFDFFAPLPFEPTLRIDSTYLAPAKVAAMIAEHFSLPIVSGS